MKIGDKIKFTGNIGTMRTGIIVKTWENDGIPWAHVKAEPYYVWEKKEDLIFVVCLDQTETLNHNKCVIEKGE